jgi:hypothetical protein
MASEQRDPDARLNDALIGFRTRHDAPWIGILGLTSCFQFFRGAPADGAVFLAAALALTLDTLGALRFAHTARMPRRLVAFSVGAIIVALLTLLPRYSFADGVIIAGIGLTLIPFAWPNPLVERVRVPGTADPRAEAASAWPRPLRRAAILWSALGVALCLWELGSFFLGMPSAEAEFAHPPLSDLIGPVLDNPLARAAGAALWLAGGAALLRRGRQE